MFDNNNSNNSNNNNNNSNNNNNNRRLHENVNTTNVERETEAVRQND